MKKLGLLLVTAVVAAAFVSCDDNDSPKVTTEETLSGFYTINGGNKSGKIPASMTAFDFATGASTDPMQCAFQNANGIALGDGAQQALIYGSKMYIAMYSSNLIWVVEPNTLKIIGSISPEGDAKSPRYLVAKNGKVYCSMYTGYVSEIDTTTLAITRNVKVGPNPDQMALRNNDIVVACSDGQNSKGNATGGVKYGNCCISIVNLESFSESRIQDLDKVLNPTDAASNGKDCFVVCKGDYYDPTKPNTVVKVVGNDVQKVCLGTNIAVDGNNLYVIYAQNGDDGTHYTYKVYDTTTLKEKGTIADQTSTADAKIDAPNGVFVDPVSGDIVMLSYTLDAAGKAQYREPSYANVYDKAGNFKKRVDCGVGARGVTFVHKTISK